MTANRNPGDAIAAAAIAAAMVEGVMAFFAATNGGVLGGAAAATAFESFGLVVLPGLVFALAVRKMPIARIAPRFGGEAIGRMLLALSVALAIAATKIAHKRLIVGAVVFVVLVAAFAFGGKRIGAAIDGFAGDELRPYVAPGAAFLGSLAIFAALAQILPPSYLFVPGAALLGWTLPVLPYGERRFDAVPKKAVVAIVLLAGVVSFATYGRVSPRARKIVLSRMHYASATLTAVHFVVDLDRDGWSPVLAGGDCNDFDAKINPAARDVPDNGIDENCSGTDAHRVPPPEQPPFTMPPAIPKKPNIVLVQLDAMRPDHVGFVGYKRPTSPNLDRWREHATWFSRAYTPGPSTRFAMAAMMTGQYLEKTPHVRGPGIRFELLPTPTFASRIAEVGYDRVGFTISYVVQHIFGMGQGFRTWETPWPADDWEKSEVQSATLTTDAGMKALGEMPDDGSKPFLLFLHYRCTHDPYVNKTNWDFGSSAMDKYDSAAAYCDEELGRFLRALDERRDAQRTATFVFSDHGELFGDHGLEYHGNSLYEPDVRILLLARVPGVGVPRVDAPVSLFDLHPTILSLAGAPPAPGAGWNLLPLMAGGDTSASEKRALFMFAQAKSGVSFHESRGVVVGREKLIRDLTSGGFELFDVVDDPEEKDDLSDLLVERRTELDDLIEGN